MENPSYITLSYQMALRRQMDAIANNLANVSTPSYKAERIMFSELVSDATSAPTLSGTSTKLSFVQEVGMLRDLSSGPLVHTGNALDLAIHGRGYFVVESPDGPRYTRSGNFGLDANGHIVTSDGFALLDEANQPITVRPGETRIEISRKGTVMTESGEIGRIRLAHFEDEQSLRKLGGGLYDSDIDPLPPDPAAEIRQGMVEGSNVEAIAEISSMIEVVRSYQAAQRILETDQELERRALEKLSRVN